jgi:hypothetical protein
MRIGEVAAQGGNVQTIRFYERRGLLKKPRRLASGYRDYPAEVVKLIHFIKRTQKQRFTLPREYGWRARVSRNLATTVSNTADHSDELRVSITRELLYPIKPIISGLKIVNVLIYGDADVLRDAVDKEETKKELLGTRVIEGVATEGTRITRKIPGGTIYNVSSKETITERWYSQELQLDALIKSHSLELTRQLTKINRSI